MSEIYKTGCKVPPGDAVSCDENGKIINLDGEVVGKISIPDHIRENENICVTTEIKRGNAIVRFFDLGED